MPDLQKKIERQLRDSNVARTRRIKNVKEDDMDKELEKLSFMLNEDIEKAASVKMSVLMDMLKEASVPPGPPPSSIAELLVQLGKPAVRALDSTPVNDLANAAVQKVAPAAIKPKGIEDLQQQLLKAFNIENI